VTKYSITSITPEAAGEITQWRYPPPYDIYDLSQEDLPGFLNPAYSYHQVRNQDGELIGYCCFGKDARVPGGDYSLGEPEVLDIGVGLRPDLTGQGLGSEFVSKVISYGIEQYQPQRLRVTIAKFNQRSLKTFQHLGFKVSKTFKRDLIEMLFCQLEKQVER
jgi:RimJ/RimL family protein N-acetyltransferase